MRRGGGVFGNNRECIMNLTRGCCFNRGGRVGRGVFVLGY